MNQSAPQNSPWIRAAAPETWQHDVFQRSLQQPVVIDFWADWCQPCRMLTPILEKLAVEYNGAFLLVKANTEQVPEAAAQFAVQSIPAVYAMRDGEVRDFFVGLLPEPQIRGWLERLLPSPAEKTTLEAQQLVSSDPAAAETKFREAIRAEPNLAAPQIGLAQLLLDQDRLDECAKTIEQLQKRGFLEPEAEKIRAALGLRQQADRAGDLGTCRAAAAQKPDDMHLQLKLAEALAAAQQYEEALQVGLKIVQSDRHGFGEEARKLMVDIFRLLPDDSELTSIYRRKLSAALY
jgi:putative thioredoxin